MEEEKIEIPDFTIAELYKVLYILVRLSGGKVGIPKAALDNMPKEACVNLSYNDKTKYWELEAPVMRKRGIIEPRKKELILP
jgi:hypothetical protein